MQYRPKPNASAYEAMLTALDIDPVGAVFIEDSAQNLKVPRAMGMQTVWLDIPTEWSARGLDRAAVDLEVTDLAAWLASLVTPAKAD
jgi:putative hydrolase of the HAD superfamily